MTTYRLARAVARPVGPPELDEHQRAVVEHDGGPLLVLAGPGTGKTTTLVEAIVDLVERRGVDPGSVLALTFSRKAAEQLRNRVTARLGRTLGTSLASTFHSFAYGLVRAYSPRERSPEPLTLVSAAEQDVMLRELLTDAPEAVTWPDPLRGALSTRGFASEVQSLLARAREQGLDPVQLEAVGKEVGRPEWESAGLFMAQYLDVLDAQSAVDYSSLLFEAVNIVATPSVQRELRATYTHVFVDEYQDTDPSQVKLLKGLAGDGRHLVAVGDPDQSIYGFRGAELRGILDFPHVFGTQARPAPVLTLASTRRFGPTMLEASRQIVRDLPTSGAIPTESWKRFRAPVSVVADNPGQVDVLTFDTDRAEAEHIADQLRRAHLEDGVPWAEMAVLVRSGRTTIPPLRRALVASGVPVDVSADETPLVREPAVAPLLDALSVVAHLHLSDPRDPDYIDPGKAESLFLSPLGGMDAADLRAVARALRRRELAGGGSATSAQLVRATLLDPDLVTGLAGRAGARAASFGRLLAKARTQLDSAASAEEVLWTLWDGADWGQRLHRTATSGRPGALMAHRDLDAVCALFDAAARAEEQRGHTSVVSFLRSLVAQQIPADTLAERGVRGDAVRLLTAHRSKGLEWRVVVVAHVQEETWPDLRRRSSLLSAERLSVDSEALPLTRSELLAEERRLFYVACTRARERLLVTAVASPDDDGERPSRFLDRLGHQVTHTQGRPPRPLSLPGLVAELRRTAANPDCADGLRSAAARRLADLADLEDDVTGRPLVPAADPATWWGTRERTQAASPLREPDEPIALSASALEAILSCPAHWFLNREAHGELASTSAQGFGNLVHTLAEHVARGELATSGDVETAVDTDLMPRIDDVWSHLIFRTPWSSSRERAEVRNALIRFLHWHRTSDRTLAAMELEFVTDVTLPDGQVVQLRGRADRLEVDAEGRVWVVDLKTGKYPPTRKSLLDNSQLGLYQLAVEHGAGGDHVPSPTVVGGAELVQLRKAKGDRPKVQSQVAQELGPDGVRPIEQQLMRAAGLVRSEQFVAIAGEHCTYCAFEVLCPVRGGGDVLS